MVNATNIIALCWLIFLVYWIINWRSVKPAQEVAWKASGFRWTMLWILVVLLLPKHSLQFLTAAATPTGALEILGLGLAVMGLLIALVARKTLADNWSSNIEFKKNHRLITDGIYGYVRHPIYTGIISMGLGSILVDQSLFVILLFIGVTAFLLFKMNKEETLLQKHFPKEYTEYKKKTKALFPFIY